MTVLSINVNKFATLRNARGHNSPNVTNVCQDIITFGGKGITVHPRPDERHIKKTDVYEIKKLLNEINYSRKEKVEFNIEGYPGQDFLAMVAEVRPDQCTLVPDGPDVITSNAGWDFVANKALLTTVVSHLNDLGVRSSLFLDVFTFNDDQLTALLEIKPDRVELYTEAYANAYGQQNESEVIEKYKSIAIKLYDMGINVNAGHDLNLDNLQKLIKEVPVIEEVSIGHALVCESLYMGLETVVRKYNSLLDHIE